MFHLQILYVVSCYSVAVPIAWLVAVASVAVATCSVYVCSNQSACWAAVLRCAWGLYLKLDGMNLSRPIARRESYRVLTNILEMAQKRLKYGVGWMPKLNFYH